MVEYLPNVMVMTGAMFLIYALGVWRISSILVKEDSPFNILERLRSVIGSYKKEGDEIGDGLDADGSPLYYERTPAGLRNTIAGIFGCVWCMSVWVGLLAVLVAVFGASNSIHVFWLVNAVMAVFALSAGAVLTELIVTRLKG